MIEGNKSKKNITCISNNNGPFDLKKIDDIKKSYSIGLFLKDKIHLI